MSLGWLVTQSYPTLWHPTGCVACQVCLSMELSRREYWMEWVAVPFFSRSSRARDQPGSPALWPGATREAQQWPLEDKGKWAVTDLNTNSMEKGWFAGGYMGRWEIPVFSVKEGLNNMTPDSQVTSSESIVWTRLTDASLMKNKYTRPSISILILFCVPETSKSTEMCLDLSPKFFDFR